MRWKAVKGFQGYQVSNTGIVRSLKHQQPIIMKQTENENGYMRIDLNQDGKHLLFVHRLVAEAFIPNPDNLKTVNHIDGNKKNNCVWNLEWLSSADNIRHYKNNNKLKIHLQVKSNHDKMIKAKGTKEVKNITTGEIFGSTKEAAKKYKTSDHAIVVAICHNHKCMDCLWEYTGNYRNRTANPIRKVSSKMARRVKDYREVAFRTWGERCFICGRPAPRTELDVHHPFLRGNGDNVVIPLCKKGCGCGAHNHTGNDKRLLEINKVIYNKLYMMGQARIFNDESKRLYGVDYPIYHIQQMAKK